MRVRLVIIGTMLAFVAGCSSGSTPTAEAPPGASVGPTVGGQAEDGLADPCSLLTSAEISAATGLTFGEGAINTTVSQETMSACDWHGPGIDTVQVLVSTVDVYESSKEAAAGVYGGADDVTVPGAPRAYAVEGGFLIGMDMDGTFLQVSFISSGSDVADATLELAAKAAGRI